MKHFDKKNPSIRSVIRATFSLPHSVADEINKLRKRFAQNGHMLNKSEVVRAGLAALGQIPRSKLGDTLSGMERLRAGRPSMQESA